MLQPTCDNLENSISIPLADLGNIKNVQTAVVLSHVTTNMRFQTIHPPSIVQMETQVGNSTLKVGPDHLYAHFGAQGVFSGSLFASAEYDNKTLALYGFNLTDPAVAGTLSGFENYTPNDVTIDNFYLTAIYNSNGFLDKFGCGIGNVTRSGAPDYELAFMNEWTTPLADQSQIERVLNWGFLKISLS